MSAMPTDEPAQDAPPSLDSQQLQQLQQQQDAQLGPQGIQSPDPPRKAKAPSVRRACVSCHTGKTRCSEVLPCQSCLKRGLGATCAYPDPEAQDHHAHHSAGKLFAAPTQAQPQPAPSTNVQFAPPPMYATIQNTNPNMAHQQFYDYNGGTFTTTTSATPTATPTAGPSTSTFRPNKRPRNLTEEETAAITRNFMRGDFFVGTSSPVRIDPRLPVKLTLGEGDHVHFTIGEPIV